MPPVFYGVVMCVVIGGMTLLFWSIHSQSIAAFVMGALAFSGAVAAMCAAWVADGLRSASNRRAYLAQLAAGTAVGAAVLLFLGSATKHGISILYIAVLLLAAAAGVFAWWQSRR